MNEQEIKTGSYSNFDTGINTISEFNSTLDEEMQKIKTYQTKLDDDNVFAGDICDSCIEGFTSLMNKLNIDKENYSTISSYLEQCKANYESADDKAKALYLAIKDGKIIETTNTNLLSTSGNIAFTENIPDGLSQRGYTVTCYGKEGWWFSGTNLVGIAGGTKQESVHEAWKKDGARYKNGIAVMNVNGQDCYLVATASSLGKVGDAINVTLKNGQQVPCVIADAKSSSDWNYTKYGHSDGKGSVNILEFEVDRHKYLEKGNPTTSSWDLEWDSSSGVKKVDNYGTILT